MVSVSLIQVALRCVKGYKDGKGGRGDLIAEIKIVVPKKPSEEEIEIFERIVEAEVGGTNYEGKLAVANVILNRVQSSRFPNTLKEVVFANRQFSPISDGRYYTVTVSETTKQVVQDALNGSRMIGEDAYYFCTPTAPGKGWFETDLRKIDYIAPHNFYGYK